MGSRCEVRGARCDGPMICQMHSMGRLETVHDGSRCIESRRPPFSPTEEKGRPGTGRQGTGEGGPGGFEGREREGKGRQAATPSRPVPSLLSLLPSPRRLHFTASHNYGTRFRRSGPWVQARLKKI